jgi:hypothetical protein
MNDVKGEKLNQKQIIIAKRKIFSISIFGQFVVLLLLLLLLQLVFSIS